MCEVRWTKTQRKMLAVLADGQPHARKELHACLPDDLGPLSNIRIHLTRIRKVLRGRGQTIICVIHRGRFCYQHVQLLGTGA